MRSPALAHCFDENLDAARKVRVRTLLPSGAHLQNAHCFSSSAACRASFCNYDRLSSIGIPVMGIMPAGIIGFIIPPIIIGMGVICIAAFIVSIANRRFSGRFTAGIHETAQRLVAQSGGGGRLRS